MHHDRTKHVELNLQFIKGKTDNEPFCTPYVASTK